MWHAKNSGGYTRLSTEATDNAQEICAILIDDFGWTLEAAAGAIGNMQYEVGLNPWRWESEHILTQQQARDAYEPSGWEYSPGYGLIGWTPAKKYQFNNATFYYRGQLYEYFPNYDQESYPGYGPNWSDVPGSVMDGAAQVRLLATAMSRRSGNIWIDHSGHLNSVDYISINTTPEYAAREFWYGAENSKNPGSISTRQTYAREIYDWLVEHGYQPSGGGIIPQIMLLIMATVNKWILKL